MSTIDPAVMAERQRLAQAVAANQADFASAIKLAQLEAAYLSADPGTPPRVARLLDIALNTLPPTHHAGIGQMVRDLHQKGMGIAPVIQQGDFPRLKALLSGQPVHQNGVAQAAAAPPPPVAPAAQPAPQAAPQAPAAAPMPGQRIIVEDIDVGHPSNTKLKEYIDGGKLAELASAYVVLDNFRMRRVIIDKIAENKSQLALACLIKVLAHTTDAAVAADIVKKAVSYDPALLQSQLVYDPNDVRGKGAVVQVMAAWKTEHVVEPLSNALGDPDPLVRAAAIGGLAEIIEADADWIGHLGSLLTSDRDAGVRLACAKALQTASTQDAFKVLDSAVKGGISDEPIKKILASWSSKSQSSSSAAQLEKRKAKMMEDKKKDKGKAAKSGGGVHLDGKAIMMLAVLVGSLALIGLGMFIYIKSFGPEPLPKVVIPPTQDQIDQKKQEMNEAKERMRKALQGLGGSK